MARADRYTNGAIAFHWVIAALILFNLWLGLFRDVLPRDWQVMPVHKSVGITVLALSLGRLAWRLTHKPPTLPAEMPGWERTFAKAVHSLFYAFMLLMPLTGWMHASASTHRRPLTWFWLFDIPYLPVGPALHEAAETAHTVIGYSWTALLVLHIAAALNHHFRRRDSVLTRMLPLVRRRT